MLLVCTQSFPIEVYLIAVLLHYHFCNAMLWNLSTQNNMILSLSDILSVPSILCYGLRSWTSTMMFHMFWHLLITCLLTYLRLEYHYSTIGDLNSIHLKVNSCVMLLVDVDQILLALIILLLDTNCAFRYPLEQADKTFVYQGIFDFLVY